MSKEDQFRVATIACASAAGALLVLLLVTWLCCCLYYEKRRQVTHVVKPRCRTEREVVRWDANPYESWGQPVQQASSSCGCGAPAGGSGGCGACGNRAASAYDWMTPRSSGAILNSSAYSPAPVKTSGGEYGRVLLNPPTGVCAKPSIPSAQYAGHCGTGGNCHGTAAVNSSGHLVSQAVGGSGAQFILESANKY